MTPTQRDIAQKMKDGWAILKIGKPERPSWALCRRGDNALRLLPEIVSELTVSGMIDPGTYSLTAAALSELERGATNGETHV